MEENEKSRICFDPEYSSDCFCYIYKLQDHNNHLEKLLLKKWKNEKGTMHVVQNNMLIHDPEIPIITPPIDLKVLKFSMKIYAGSVLAT